MLTEIAVDGPKNVCIEASWEAIEKADINWMEGEHFDWVRNCISITDDGRKVTFTTCRSIEAWQRGEENAGRYTLEIEHRHLQCIYIDKTPVWGKPGD